MSDPDWQADRRRCDAGAAVFLREQSLWALWVYRFGRRVKALRGGPRQRLWQAVYRLLHTVVETATGITLPQDARIGPGLRIWHFGGVVVHPQVRIGAGCTLRHGVTLGVREVGGPCPVLEDEVELGACAQVLGGVRLGRGCRIGALALVLHDVPPGATAVGMPARVLGSTEAGPRPARRARMPRQEQEA